MIGTEHVEVKSLSVHRCTANYPWTCDRCRTFTAEILKTSYEEHITDSLTNAGPTLVRQLHVDGVASSLQAHNTRLASVIHGMSQHKSKHTAAK